MKERDVYGKVIDFEDKFYLSSVVLFQRCMMELADEEDGNLERAVLSEEWLESFVALITSDEAQRLIEYVQKEYGNDA